MVIGSVVSKILEGGGWYYPLDAIAPGHGETTRHKLTVWTTPFLLHRKKY